MFLLVAAGFAISHSFVNKEHAIDGGWRAGGGLIDRGGLIVLSKSNSGAIIGAIIGASSASFSISPGDVGDAGTAN